MVWKQNIFNKDQTWKREDVVDFEEQTNDVPKSEYEAHSMELKDNITFEMRRIPIHPATYVKTAPEI